MKKALVLFIHGIGDLICFTPVLRELYREGYQCDILCRDFVADSSLLDACPYESTVIKLPVKVSPSAGGEEGHASRVKCKEEFDSLRIGYSVAMQMMGTPDYVRGGKVSMFFDAARRAGVRWTPRPRTRDLEVYISQGAEKRADAFVKQNYPNGFIFSHTHPNNHTIHSWDAAGWVSANLPDLPVFTPPEDKWKDINVSFAIMKRATHTVLASSVFVHAGDAMGLEMDAVNYGRDNTHGYPEKDRIKLMRRTYVDGEQWSKDGGLKWTS